MRWRHFSLTVLLRRTVSFLQDTHTVVLGPECQITGKRDIASIRPATPKVSGREGEEGKRLHGYTDRSASFSGWGVRGLDSAKSPTRLERLAEEVIL